MSSSIIEASANFLAILFAALAFRTEKLNTAKVLGCALGFAGVALVNLSGADGTFGFRLDGEGFILASTVAGALSTCLIGIFSRASTTASCLPGGSSWSAALSSPPSAF